MKKLNTVFKKDPNDLGRVINEVDPKNVWAITGEGIPTRKFDGTACAIIEGQFYKRFDSKINKKTGKRKPVPDGAIPCQEPDKSTGHWPHWILCDRSNPSDKYHFEAFDRIEEPIDHELDGTYELCGEKIQGNPEKIQGHKLIPHGCEPLYFTNFSFEGIKEYLQDKDIEGIVFHHKDDNFLGRMCKIRKSDYGIRR